MDNELISNQLLDVVTAIVRASKDQIGVDPKVAGITPQILKDLGFPNDTTILDP